MAQRKRKKKWTWSDRLAIALACLAGILALILLWMEKTPIWAGVTIALMGALVVYPVIHFAPSWKARVPALIVAWGLIGVFGWRIWPQQHTSIPDTSLSPEAVKEVEAKGKVLGNKLIGEYVAEHCPADSAKAEQWVNQQLAVQLPGFHIYGLVLPKNQDCTSGMRFAHTKDAQVNGVTIVNGGNQGIVFTDSPGATVTNPTIINGNNNKVQAAPSQPPVVPTTQPQ
jgi:hypothetical protein